LTEKAEIRAADKPNAAQSEGRNFSVALCGGKTPYGVYAMLAKPEFREKIILPPAYIPNRQSCYGGLIPKQQGCLKSRILQYE
jgi:hypothetical protein